MTSILFGISVSALLSATSLLIVLFRVSPLTAPLQAVTAFFVSLFLTVTTISMLLFVGIWKAVPNLNWDTAKLMSISMRQGIFLGIGTVLVLLFHLMQLLTWWVALLIYGVFILIELALEH